MQQAGRLILYFGLFLARFVLFPFYFLSGFPRRRPELWVFGSWGGYRFADNSAAFFLHCQREYSDHLRLVWISRNQAIVDDLRDRGYEAHKVWSLAGLRCCLQAKLYIFDSFVKDINFWTSRGATKVNLWSGVPLKAFERDISNPRSRYYRLFHGSLPERWLLAMMMPWHVDRPDLIIATSEETARITRRAFDIPGDTVVVSGFPRNDILFPGPDEQVGPRPGWTASFARAVEDGQRILMYLPTYRDSGESYFNVDWSELDRLMEELGATFFFKFHPDEQSTFRGQGQHVVELEQECDIYSMMAHTDVLISDYSSIIFDFMLLGRPIVYYTPDLDAFVKSSRSLIFQPVDIAVGPVCTTAAELFESLKAVVSGESGSASDVARWAETRRRFNAHVDGHSSQRVAEMIDSKVLQGQLKRFSGEKSTCN